MTRKEQRQSAAEKAYPYKEGTKGYICKNSIPIFIQGAEWADKTMLDNVCEWLKDNAPSYTTEGASYDVSSMLVDLSIAMGHLCDNSNYILNTPNSNIKDYDSKLTNLYNEIKNTDEMIRLFYKWLNNKEQQCQKDNDADSERLFSGVKSMFVEIFGWQAIKT